MIIWSGHSLLDLLICLGAENPTPGVPIAITGSRSRPYEAVLHQENVDLAARWRAALPVMGRRIGSRPCGENEHIGFNPHEGQRERRRCGGDEEPGHADGLAERAIRPAIVERRFALRGRLCCGDFDNAAKALRPDVDVSLGDIGLQQKGEDNNEHA
ncbi:MAG: hypothetical protein KGL29_14605 [Alphaproteobacteria bacterium]|nr:hypothetical protein [Alphaproteobacteria bacterium]